jgi:hypothetical protein
MPLRGLWSLSPPTRGYRACRQLPRLQFLDSRDPWQFVSQARFLKSSRSVLQLERNWWNNTIFYLNVYLHGQEFLSLHERYRSSRFFMFQNRRQPIRILTKVPLALSPGEQNKSTHFWVSLFCSPGRIRTCDQSITRIPMFPKGVDYIITRVGWKALPRISPSTPVRDSL